jgi:hypothetical protein
MDTRQKCAPFRIVENLGVGTQRYFLAPAGVIPTDKLPNKWGLIEVEGNGVIGVIRCSGKFDASRENEIRMIISAHRRLQGATNATR